MGAETFGRWFCAVLPGGHSVLAKGGMAASRIFAGTVVVIGSCGVDGYTKKNRKGEALQKGVNY